MKALRITFSIFMLLVAVMFVMLLNYANVIDVNQILNFIVNYTF